MPPNQIDQRRCDQCGEHLRAVPMRHRDGSVSYSYECGNFKCKSGSGGLMTIRTSNKNEDPPTQVTKFWNTEEFQHYSTGPPSQGESNVERVAKYFIEAANREYGAKFDPFQPTPEQKGGETGHDCILYSADGNVFKIQVTRVLPQQIYESQANAGKRHVEGKLRDAKQWILDAIHRKSNNAATDIALVLDGLDAPPIGFGTDILVRVECEEYLASQGWHSIWIMGMFGLRHLAGEGILAAIDTTQEEAPVG